MCQIRSMQCSSLLLTIAIQVCSISLIAKPINEANHKQIQSLAKNTIFVIGDGMGSNAITLARIWSQGSTGSLVFEQFKDTGFVKTYSSSDYVTDSAAAATALSTGVKTYNGSIAMTDKTIDPQKKSRKLESIMDLARKAGKSTGIVTTATVTHATPASFYAHSHSRNDETHIASQAINMPLDVILGGGRCFFYPNNWKDPINKKSGARIDGRDLISEAKSKGWTFADNLDELRHLTLSPPSKLLGLFNYHYMSYDLDRQNEHLNEPSLEEMVQIAIKILSKNPKGYFLLVEAGRIDHAGHENKARHIAGETVALHRGVKKILSLTNASETLLVITADHETGGLALSGSLQRDKAVGDRIFQEEISFHGPAKFHVTFATGPGGGKYSHPNKNNGVHPALYQMSAASHTAQDVPIFAMGPYSNLFRGFQDNEEIPWKIAKALGLKFSRSSNIENHKILNREKLTSIKHKLISATEL